ncbi:MAG TPA: DUF3574 domain-containing protein [Gemmatimonadales bacterium]|nr:DUF3574 domain-containing protein [Gemmatimonadales bacterium]
MYRACSTSRLTRALALAGAAGCAAPNPAPAPPPAPAAAPGTPAIRCEPGDSALVRDVIYFGRNRPDGGVVSDAEWLDYLDSVVTPRFPEGLTVVDARGQWRGRGGAVERERAEVLTLFHPDDVGSRRAVDELAAEYKRRFGQEAVLRERVTACTRF